MVGHTTPSPHLGLAAQLVPLPAFSRLSRRNVSSEWRSFRSGQIRVRSCCVEGRLPSTRGKEVDSKNLEFGSDSFLIPSGHSHNQWNPCPKSAQTRLRSRTRFSAIRTDSGKRSFIS